MSNSRAARAFSKNKQADAKRLDTLLDWFKTCQDRLARHRFMFYLLTALYSYHVVLYPKLVQERQEMADAAIEDLQVIENHARETQKAMCLSFEDWKDFSIINQTGLQSTPAIIFVDRVLTPLQKDLKKRSCSPHSDLTCPALEILQGDVESLLSSLTSLNAIFQMIMSSQPILPDNTPATLLKSGPRKHLRFKVFKTPHVSIKKLIAATITDVGTRSKCNSHDSLGEAFVSLETLVRFEKAIRAINQVRTDNRTPCKSTDGKESITVDRCLAMFAAEAMTFDADGNVPRILVNDEITSNLPGYPSTLLAYEPLQDQTNSYGQSAMLRLIPNSDFSRYSELAHRSGDSVRVRDIDDLLKLEATFRELSQKDAAERTQSSLKIPGLDIEIDIKLALMLGPLLSMIMLHFISLYESIIDHLRNEIHGSSATSIDNTDFDKYNPRIFFYYPSGHEIKDTKLNPFTQRIYLLITIGIPIGVICVSFLLNFKAFLLPTSGWASYFLLIVGAIACFLQLCYFLIRMANIRLAARIQE